MYISTKMQFVTEFGKSKLTASSKLEVHAMSPSNFHPENMLHRNKSSSKIDIFTRRFIIVMLKAWEVAVKSTNIKGRKEPINQASLLLRSL